MDDMIYDSDWNLKQPQLNEPLQEPVPFEEFQFSLDLNIPTMLFPENHNINNINSNDLFLEPPPPPFLPMEITTALENHNHTDIFLDDSSDNHVGGSILDDSDRKAFNQFLDTFCVDPNIPASSASSLAATNFFEAPPSLYLDQPLPAFDNLSLKDNHYRQCRKPSDDSSSNHSTGGSGGGGPVRRSKLHKELLTEEEKRNRHISSEHRRRDMIRSGFENLSELVPTLLSNNSRSTILFKAADYIKRLERRNRHLRKKIKMLQIRVEGSKLYRY